MLKDCFKDLLQPPAQPAAADSQAAQRAQRAQRHAQFEPLLKSSPHLQQVLQAVATIAQMTLLDPVSTATSAAEASGSGTVLRSLPEAAVQSNSAEEGSVCVVNSHFFFHPNASHVRNIHTAAIMSEVQDFMDTQKCSMAEAAGQPLAVDARAAGGGQGVADDCQASAKRQCDGDRQPALVFIGDLNSDFNDGTPGTQASAGADSSPSWGQTRDTNTHPTLLFCGDLNCGLNHGTPGSGAQMQLLCLTCYT